MPHSPRQRHRGSPRAVPGDGVDRARRPVHAADAVVVGIGDVEIRVVGRDGVRELQERARRHATVAAEAAAAEARRTASGERGDRADRHGERRIAGRRNDDVDRDGRCCRRVQRQIVWRERDRQRLSGAKAEDRAGRGRVDERSRHVGRRIELRRRKRRAVADVTRRRPRNRGCDGRRDRDSKGQLLDVRDAFAIGRGDGDG